MPGEGPMVQPEIIREQLIRMMTNMDQKGIEKMADYIVYLIMKVRDTNKWYTVVKERDGPEVRVDPPVAEPAQFLGVYLQLHIHFI